MDDGAAQAFIREMADCNFCPPGQWFQLAIARRADDALIGDIGLHLNAQSDAAEVGFTLARSAQGQGLAQEAVAAALDLVFAHTPAQRVLGITDTRNTASVRLLHKLGMKRFSSRDTVFRGESCREDFFVRYRLPIAAPLLRAATAADALAVARVLIDSRRELMPFAPSVHRDDEVRDWVAHTLIPGGGVTVAQISDSVVGVLAISAATEGAWIKQLYVHPSAAAAGVGRALLGHALRHSARPLWLYTFAANHHARAFYERHQFVAVAFGDGSGNEEGRPDVLYRLDAVPSPS